MLVVRKLLCVRNAEGLYEDFMSIVAVPSYHFGILKGYLLGQNAPNEILLAAEALHIAAVQGPLRNDALEAIRLVAEAAEKLMSRVDAVPVSEMPKRPVNSVEAPEKPIENAESGEVEIDLPPITKRALEMASKREELPPVKDESDEAKIEAFLNAKIVTSCPPAHAAGSDLEAVVGESAPKKRKEWSPEARAAAAERMRKMQERKRAGRNYLANFDREEDPPHGDGNQPIVRGDAGNGEAPEKSGADGFIIDPKTGYEINPKTGAIKLF